MSSRHQVGPWLQDIGSPASTIVRDEEQHSAMLRGKHDRQQQAVMQRHGMIEAARGKLQQSPHPSSLVQLPVNELLRHVGRCPRREADQAVLPVPVGPTCRVQKRNSVRQAAGRRQSTSCNEEQSFSKWLQQDGIEQWVAVLHGQPQEICDGDAVRGLDDDAFKACIRRN
eukprot:349632-Chlamydomonas_euryale.AAC.20